MEYIVRGGKDHVMLYHLRKYPMYEVVIFPKIMQISLATAIEIAQAIEEKRYTIIEGHDENGVEVQLIQCGCNVLKVAEDDTPTKKEYLILKVYEDVIVAEKTYGYLDCPDPDLAGMHCTFITVDGEEYFCGTDGISHKTSCASIYEDDDIIVLTKKQFNIYFEPVPTIEDALDELDENVYVVVHYTTNEEAVKAIITDVPDDADSEEIKEKLEKAGYEFGEFNIAWANHYISPLKKCSEPVINTVLRILKGSEEAQSLGKLVFEPVVLSYEKLASEVIQDV